MAQFDFIDNLDKQNLLRFSFENKLLTKEGKRGSDDLVSRQIMRMIPYFDMNYDTHRLENVGYDIELRPFSWMGIDSDALYNTREKHFDNVNFDTWFEHGKFRVALGQRYVFDSGNQTTLDVRYRLNKDWEIKLYERYDIDRGLVKEQSFVHDYCPGYFLSHGFLAQGNKKAKSLYPKRHDLGRRELIKTGAF